MSNGVHAQEHRMADELMKQWEKSDERLKNVIENKTSTPCPVDPSLPENVYFMSCYLRHEAEDKRTNHDALRKLAETQVTWGKLKATGTAAVALIIAGATVIIALIAADKLDLRDVLKFVLPEPKTEQVLNVPTKPNP